VLDEGVAEKLQAQLGGKPIIVFPDIVDDSPPDPGFLPALQIREKANGRKIIGLLGVLSKRKGVLVLMQVARQATQENWYFVFAGELAKESFSSQEQQEILEFAQSKPSNCFFHWQRIPDEAQFNALVNECDVLFAVYQNFLSSSNLLTKAALFQKPVLVSDAYCMGERVRKFGIGLVIAENSVPQCVAALYRLCDPMAQDQQLPVARFDEYLRLHSIEQLRTAFQAVLTAASL
jgi:glycosyltransferase involved in cell wall biosynthesis